VARGHRRIAYIGAPEEITLQAERSAGYRDDRAGDEGRPCPGGALAPQSAGLD
jgi:DNA-binding LacI/PurR family transcriptional regulator